MKYPFPISILLLAIMMQSCFDSAPGNENPALSPGEILQRSLQFHDPGERWPTASLHFIIDEPRLQNPERQSEVFVNNAKEDFRISRRYDNNLVIRGIVGDSCFNFVDGVLADPADTATIRLHRLDCERTQGYRSFYQLLNGLPMSLYSPDVQLLPEVTPDSIGGKPALRLTARINDAAIGEEWFFYFSPENFQLLGYGYAAEGAGEILRLDGIVEAAGMKLPRMRHWHNRLDGAYLGSDIHVVVEEWAGE